MGHNIYDGEDAATRRKLYKAYLAGRAKGFDNAAFPRRIPDNQESVRFDIPAYIVNELADALSRNEDAAKLRQKGGS
ncbi:MAG: hypothetical protein ACYTEQ_30990 [Planctomycetota bacterium]|jgi:hypothetical protein